MPTLTLLLIISSESMLSSNRRTIERPEPTLGEKETVSPIRFLKRLEEAVLLLGSDSLARISNRNFDLIPCHGVGSHLYRAAFLRKPYRIGREIEQHAP